MVFVKLPSPLFHLGLHWKLIIYRVTYVPHLFEMLFNFPWMMVRTFLIKPMTSNYTSIMRMASFLRQKYNFFNVIKNSMFKLNQVDLVFGDFAFLFYFWLRKHMITSWPSSGDRVLCSLTLKDARFRMKITLGVVLIRSLVRAVCVPGHLRSGSGVTPKWRVQKKVFKTGIARLKSGFQSNWTSETTSLLLYPQFPRELEWCSLLVIWEHLSFMPNYS